MGERIGIGALGSDAGDIPPLTLHYLQGQVRLATTHPYAGHVHPPRRFRRGLPATSLTPPFTPLLSDCP